ncbi:MAG: M20/M25/M40 family metallo-hydrolase [Firmicutes bacterium]|nr:M20/M25/M40 family metallo-hydrolase [Bacillota bacterium]
MDLAVRAKELSLQLVQADSVVGSPGEAEIAKLIEKRLRNLPYFKKHPDHLFLQETSNDDRLRYNVIALALGEKAKSEDTLLILGHLDTVGIDDYQNLKEFAFDSPALKEKLKGLNFSEEIKKDVEDPNWLFGRGLLDMKAGLAAQILALEDIVANISEFSGNLVFLAECDEEDNSRGILSALPFIEELTKKHRLKLTGSINADYTAPRYTGDDSRYLYYGTVGKQLPAFYIVGKETHVGDPFAGLDPNFVASFLIKELNYNPEYCDIAADEVSTPPISLKLQDFKTFYTVQTNLSTQVYFNFAVHALNAEEIIALMKKAAEKAAREAEEVIQERFDRYCQLNRISKRKLDWQIRILSYQDIVNQAIKAKGPEFKKELEQKAEDLLKENLDLREYNLAMVQFVWKQLPDQSPAIVLYFGSMYYPAIALDREIPSHHKLIRAAEKAVDDLKVEEKYKMQKRFFFPYIADSSFLSLNDDEDSLKAYVENYPAHLKYQRTDFDLINRLSMPVINIGAYGKEAHQFLERLDAAYSFGVVPPLIQQTIKNFFEN